MYPKFVTSFYKAVTGPKMAKIDYFMNFKAHRGHTLQLFMAHVIRPCLKLSRKTIFDAFWPFK